MIDATVHAVQQSSPFVGPDDAAAYGISPDALIPEDAILVVPKNLLAPSSFLPIGIDRSGRTSHVASPRGPFAGTASIRERSFHAACI